MPNTYFQFKQFIIDQDRTAMKVCTDACLFGAWTANQIESGKGKVENVLDIGAGTGLLSLMLAQKTAAEIDAVEIDEAAAQQAKENFENAKWSARLHLHRSTIQNFSASPDRLNNYDIIISNPPFFQASLKSNNQQKNLAKHNTSLTYVDLATIVFRLLDDQGLFYILLPFPEFESFLATAHQQNLFLHQQLNIQQTPSHSFFRTVGVFSKQTAAEIRSGSIIIKQNQQEYTAEFIELLQDYYLNL